MEYRIGNAEPGSFVELSSGRLWSCLKLHSLLEGTLPSLQISVSQAVLFALYIIIRNVAFGSVTVRTLPRRLCVCQLMNAGEKEFKKRKKEDEGK